LAIASLIFSTTADRFLTTSSFLNLTVFSPISINTFSRLASSSCANRYFLVLPFDGGTFHTVIFTHVHGITICAQIDYLIAFRTTSWLEFGWIFKFFKIVLVRPIVDIHLCLKIVPAFLARLPIARMPLVEMMTAQRITIMIAGTTISGIRE